MSEMNNVVEAFSDEEMEDYAAIFTRFINGLCRFADRHNYDRDNIMKYTAQRFSVFAEITTVENLVLKEAPTIDPVIRCRDCAVPHNKWTGCPKLNGLVPPDNFYCAFGVRRADDGKSD